MPEPQKVVHLTAAQRKRKKFKHPLLDDVPCLLTPEQFDELLSAYFGADKDDARHSEARQELIVSYFRLLRSVVARFLYHWPISRRFLDEMVSKGAEVITKTIANLEPNQLYGGDDFNALGGLIESSIRYGIEDTINKLRGVVPASRRTNHYRERAGKSPVYGSIEADLMSEEVQNSQTYTDIDTTIFEVQDSLREIAKTDIEVQVLKQENWQLSDAELAKKLGRTERGILWIRTKLRERYNKLENGQN